MEREMPNKAYFSNLSNQYQREVAERTKKYDVLKNLDLFILDNSIRESTVGQLRGHTLESKWEVYNEVKKCGFTNMIVASFSHMTRVDDVFIKQLVEKGEDRNGLYGFSEITHAISNKVPDTKTVPVGLRKLKEGGLWHVIFEVDLGDATYDFKRFTMDDMCNLIKKWIVWAHDNLHEESKVFINLRDPPDVMPEHSDRCFQLVHFLATLPNRLRPAGMLFEEPRGKSLPEECGTWTKYIRKIMDDNNWKGHLLVHVHQKFDLCEATALQALMDGANGLWSSICIEGAAMGNASSCVTMLNLLRLGNKKILKNYNCQYLRKAAINVTKITTGVLPHEKQPIYGTRALDFVYDVNPEDFDLADFFGEEAPVRITTMASPEMIQQKLIKIFGKEEQFTTEIALSMKECMLDDLRSNRKEEYMSPAGLAVLFDRAGGSMTKAMRDVIEKMELQGPHAENLIAQIRKIWDTWDLKDEVQGDDQLEYDSFYNGFMAPFFACYRCSDTKKALQALDMDADNQIDWSEFMVYLKWALRQYPNIKDTDELLDVTFRKGIIPAMRDELQKREKERRAKHSPGHETIHVENKNTRL